MNTPTTNAPPDDAAIETMTFEERLSRAMAASGLDEAAFRRAAVERAVRREERRQTRLAKRREDVDEPLLSRLRVIVARALREAESWRTVQARLRESRVEFAVAGGGLALISTDDKRKLCKASEVGPGYKLLVRKLRAPFPGHPHAWIARDALAEPGAVRPADRRERPDDALIDYAP